MRKLIALVLLAALVSVLSICPALAFSEPSAEPAAAAAQADGTATEIIKAPTCSEAGTAAVYEVATGTILRMILLPATGEHNYVAEVIEPTCEEAGGTRYTCTICGDTYLEDVVPALGHSYVYQYDAVRNADGTFSAYGTWKCENCGDTVEATEGNAVYYYGLQDGKALTEAPAEEAAPAVDGAPVEDASAEPAEEAPAEEAAPVEEASAEPAEEGASEEAPAEEAAPANPNYDPAGHNWASIEIILALIIVVVGAVLMLSFGKKNG